MLDKDSLQAIRDIMKEEIRYQNEHINSKLTALKTDIIEEISKFHVEIISDNGTLLDNEILPLKSSLSAQSLMINKHEKDIQALQLKVG